MMWCTHRSYYYLNAFSDDPPEPATTKQGTNHEQKKNTVWLCSEMSSAYEPIRNNKDSVARVPQHTMHVTYPGPLAMVDAPILDWTNFIFKIVRERPCLLERETQRQGATAEGRSHHSNQSVNTKHL